MVSKYQPFFNFAKNLEGTLLYFSPTRNILENADKYISIYIVTHKKNIWQTPKIKHFLLLFFYINV